jgi:16S rRNA (cytosine1402-N4)-methyltransferase
MAPVESKHVPVLAGEVLQWLDPRPGDVLVDGTVGGGGHARLMAERVGPQGRILALDRDPSAVTLAAAQLADQPVELIQADYCELPAVLRDRGIEQVDGILLDLGLSSDQLADPSRGFSFASDGELDLRFDPSQGEPAWQLIERLDADELADLIFTYGEERHSRRIARRIVAAAREQQVRTAPQLAALVRSCVPRARHHRIDPATRTFQALRIAVNDELGSLQRALERFPDCLRAGRRLAVISFHSLEDRPVKVAFRCDPRYQVLTKKPVRPGPSELAVNPRSRSARLRVAERSRVREPGASSPIV